MPLHPLYGGAPTPRPPDRGVGAPGNLKHLTSHRSAGPGRRPQRGTRCRYARPPEPEAARGEARQSRQGASVGLPAGSPPGTLASYGATAMQFADLEGRGVRRDPARSGSDSGSSRRLGAAGLTALIFFSVSGGPFGFEEAVDAGGSAWVLIGCLLVPLLWSVPEALMTAELSSAFPEAVRPLRAAQTFIPPLSSPLHALTPSPPARRPASARG